jgi:CRISPR/Cas system-associated endonuclease Cas1
MESLLKTLNHPKYIWYFIKGEKTWYLPYFTGIPLRLKKNVWQFTINETELIDIDLSKTSSILFYESNDKTGALPIEFLKECSLNKVGLIIHQNHITDSLNFFPSQQVDRDDLLSKQIRHRDNQKKRAYIARTLIKWQWSSREWLCPTHTPFEKLAALRSSEDVMRLEAIEAKNYWSVYYRKLGLPELSRLSDHPINNSLDTLSQILSGLTLRWVLAHGLSPSHGYLHSSTGLSSLVNDFTELTRAWTEKSVYDAFSTAGESDLIHRSTLNFKTMLEMPIHTEPTRQKVYRRVLINGSVISLRYYLSGKMKHFLPPVEQSAKARGRKRLCAYSLPGHIWEH